MKRVPIVIMAFVVALVGVTVFLTDRAKPEPAPAAAVDAANLVTRVFAVDHMTCATCPIAVKKAMAAVAGVASVEVDFDTKQATVTFDPASATAAQIADASTSAGYPATPRS